MGLIEIFYGVFGLWVVLLVAAMVHLKSFLSSQRFISTFTDIEDFKKVARL
jgi:hypothetical protein